MLMISLFYSNRMNTSRTFRDYLNTSYPNVPIFYEQERDGKSSFLYIEVFLEKGKFVGTVFRKPTFSSVYTYFESFLSIVCKFVSIYTLAYPCFKICYD